jgi:nucleotide-binding universal stress UspA family protein
MTGLKTLFAVVPSSAGVAAVVAAFRALPLASGAKLIGIHVSPLAARYGFAADMALAGYIEAQVAAAQEALGEAQAAFADACRAAGIDFEWRVDRTVDYRVSSRTGALARAADLILCPQLPAGASLAPHEIEEVVFASGRPVVGVPQEWTGRSIGKRVVVAWDGGREAARAVFDALPLLAQAEQVRTVSVQGFLDEPVRQFTPADEICATLSRHGVKVESHTFRNTRASVAEELAAQMLDVGADLLVMGCYGHSKLREVILGGVSHDVLKGFPHPILLSN